MDAVLDDHAAASALLAEHGSPINLIDPARLDDHAAELVAAGEALGIPVHVFFARKANKTLALVDRALAAGHGIDVASLRELTQVLGRGAGPEQVIVTAAVKPRSLVEASIDAGVVVSLDNLDEVALVREVAAERERDVRVALRLAPELSSPAGDTRFGLPAGEWAALLATGAGSGSGSATAARLQVEGIHVHLHGYDAADRTAALAQAMDLCEEARRLGHGPTFVDLGGGIPMRYVDEPGPWTEFWTAHRDGVAQAASETGGGDTLTWKGRPLGTAYPMWQDPVRGAWLTEALRPVADRMRALGLSLHLEPGRTLLDGCGLTLARVEMRKRARDGSLLVGLAMNRTQCRSAADDFILDPVLVPHPDGVRCEPGEGFLVGAYCIEAELLTWRRLAFDEGVAVGDVVGFVNTAGYQMHILESASHQIPLARNLVPSSRDDAGIPTGWRLDDIDRPTS